MLFAHLSILKLFRCFQFPRQVIIYKTFDLLLAGEKEKIYHNVLITDWIVHCVRFHHIFGSMSGAVTGRRLCIWTWMFRFVLIVILSLIFGLWGKSKQCGNSANTQVLATAPLITRWARMIYELWK